MKIINFNFNLMDLDMITPLPDNAAKYVAFILKQETKGNSIKLYDWAISLYNKGEIQVDNADLITLKNIISSSDIITTLVKGPLLKYIESI